jgi:hypothetical protein
MNFFSKVLDAVKHSWHKFTGAADEFQQQAYNALQRDTRTGDLEKRFTPLRPLGGWRLRRTGKHRFSKNPRPMQERRAPKGCGGSVRGW